LNFIADCLLVNQSTGISYEEVCFDPCNISQTSVQVNIGQMINVDHVFRFCPSHMYKHTTVHWCTINAVCNSYGWGSLGLQTATHWINQLICLACQRFNRWITWSKEFFYFFPTPLLLRTLSHTSINNVHF